MKLEQRVRRLPRRDRERVIRVIRRILEKDDRVIFAYVHGSIVEGEYVRDIDIAVWLRDGIDPFEYILDESVKLEELLGMPVDIHALNQAPLSFKYNVYTRGRPLLIRDEMLHDTEVAKTILMMWDILELERLLRRNRAPDHQEPISRSGEESGR